MRFSASMVLNLLAWAVIAGLIAAAIVVADLLGFFGLFLLGAATWLVCLRAALDEDAPGWGVHVFSARMQTLSRLEERAASRAQRQEFLSPLRFYRNCGIALAAIGAAGFALQVWRQG